MREGVGGGRGMSERVKKSPPRFTRQTDREKVSLVFFFLFSIFFFRFVRKRKREKKEVNKVISYSCGGSPVASFTF